MDKNKTYDYLENSIMSQKDIVEMVKVNPYKRYMLFNTIEVSEHRHFNKIYSLGYNAGAFTKLIEMGKLLREKGIGKEEIRQMINTTLGQELLKPDNNG